MLEAVGPSRFDISTWRATGAMLRLVSIVFESSQRGLAYSVGWQPVFP